ncbi:hypothetical protein PTUN_a2318 [Pseudoalteromonas tunicata]|nr:hypothetical protein PTUN_a2318 [Pseudoalteromonas tunicata]
MEPLDAPDFQKIGKLIFKNTFDVNITAIHALAWLARVPVAHYSSNLFFQV